MSEPLALELASVSKVFGSVRALDDVSVTAARGEFLTILGHSGSGKTTLLRLVSGLDQPTSAARLAIAGRDVTGVPAYRRNVSTVFQHYGLFPHMSVGENVEYGLKLRGVGTAERRRQALAMLERVRLPGKDSRRIHQLSGGERQRVALARSLVLEPDILLLDEPLGALDERLRLDMQIELVDLQRALGTTFVFITHSQEEAITMSDRIVLMRGGRIVQEGAPRDLFERPVDEFAARFMGVENVFRGRIAAVAGREVTLDCGGVALAGSWSGAEAPRIGAVAAIAVRAEKVATRPLGTAEPGNRLAGRVHSRVYRGKYVDVVVETAIGRCVARSWQDDFGSEDAVETVWSPSHGVVAPAEGV